MIKDSFLNLFPLLTAKQKSIWKYLQWYSQKFRHVFPSQKTIAQAVGCHRDTVIEVLKKFTEWGWLSFFKRAYRSNLYFMSEELININTDKAETFKRETIDPTENPTSIPTENPTLVNSNNSNIERSNVRAVETVQNINQNEFIAFEVKELPIPHKDKVLFSKYSPAVLRLAIEDFKTYSRLYRVRDLPRFLMSRIKSYVFKFKKSPAI